MTRATGRDGLHDVLRAVGDLSAAEVAERVFEGVDAAALLEQLQRERRAIRLRLGGEERYVAADEAGLYRDALGAMPPGGLPEAFIADVPDALRELLGRYARTHGPFGDAELRARYGVDGVAVLRELERDGEIVRGELRPGGSEREWCDVEVLRRLRRASLAALRKEIEPADRRRLAAFLPSWQGVDRHAPAGAGVDRLREVLVPLQGLALPAESWERDVLPRRTGAYSQAWLDTLCASGELVWVGAGASGRSGRVALYFREDAVAIGPPSARGGRPCARGRGARARAGAPGPGAVLLHRPAGRGAGAGGGAARGAVGSRVGGRGHERRLGAAARARARARPRAGRLRRSGPGTVGKVPLRLAPAQRGPVAGPGALVVDGAGVRAGRCRLGTRAPARPRRAVARALRDRDPRAGAGRGHPGRLRDALRHVREPRDARALPPRLLHRGHGRGAVRAARRGRAAALGRPGARGRRGEGPRTLVLAAADPAQPYGAALPWPRRAGQERRPARVAGAYVVLVDEEPALYVERGGRGLQSLADSAHAAAAGGREEGLVEEGLAALAAAVRAGRVPKLSLERIDGEPAIASPLAEALIALGFQSGPRRLTLSA